MFATNLLACEKGLPKPDLAHHTLIHFLDKFVYRSPKAAEAQRGSSIMQPVLATGNSTSVAMAGKDGVKRRATVNSASFWNLKPDQVAAEDVFFHQYFAQIGKPSQAAKAKKAKAADAGDDDEDDEAEEEIWGALVNSRPQVQGDDDGGEGFDTEDVDYDSDDSLDLGSDDEGSDGGAALGSDISSGDDGGFEGIFGDSDESDVDAEADSEGEDTAAVPIKGKAKGGRLGRKELRSLPMFASADDYAEMLANEDDMDG